MDFYSMLLAKSLSGDGGGSPSSNNGVPPKAVNFIDYDGTIVAAYSASEFASLSSLPSNPTHEGLTAQGWNWNLADAKSKVAIDGKLIIGQMFVTESGKTEVDVVLRDGRLSPRVEFGLNGSAVIDWGDGNTDTVSGSNVDIAVYADHTYSVEGEYTVTIAVTGTAKLLGDNNSSCSYLFTSQTNDKTRYVYQTAIKAVRVGVNMSLGDYAFAQLFALRSITIPHEVTGIGVGNFSNCNALKSVTIPDGVTIIEQSAFYSCSTMEYVSIPNSITSVVRNAFVYCYSLISVTIPDEITLISQEMCYYCYSLISVTIPDAVTVIKQSAFERCNSLKSITFLSTIPPTLESTNVFSQVASDCVFYVPLGSVEDYKTANYWSSYTSRIQAIPTT